MEQLTFDQSAADDAPAVKLCECGCGRPTLIAKQTHRQSGVIKGQPRRVIQGHYASRPAVLVEVGQRIGRGVVTETGFRIPRSSRSNGTERGARLLCDCGNEYRATIASLVRQSGPRLSCGCLKRDRSKDRTGQRHGKLVALQPVGLRQDSKNPENKVMYWLCRCDCGNEAVVNGRSLGNGGTKSCGCARRQPLKGYLPGRAARNRVFDGYQRQAKHRGLPWALTGEDFDRLTSQDCHYCGQPPSMVKRSGRYEGGEFVYSGIDRMDNDLGYLAGNVVSCCSTCNHAKMDMAFDDFMAWIARLTEYHWSRSSA